MIKHIDGLNGQEEQAVVSILNRETEKKILITTVVLISAFYWIPKILHEIQMYWR